MTQDQTQSNQEYKFVSWRSGTCEDIAVLASNTRAPLLAASVEAAARRGGTPAALAAFFALANVLHLQQSQSCESCAEFTTTLSLVVVRGVAYTRTYKNAAQTEKGAPTARTVFWCNERGAGGLLSLFRVISWSRSKKRKGVFGGVGCGDDICTTAVSGWWERRDGGSQNRGRWGTRGGRHTKPDAIS